MNTSFRHTLAAAALLCGSMVPGAAGAVVTTFFDASQSVVTQTSGQTFDTIRSEGYLFRYTLDKLFTGNTGSVIGRTQVVTWPAGLHAQAVTTPPSGQRSSPASVTISRVDGAVFDLTAFSFKLLANTAGAGGAVEVVPQLGGEDLFNDPIQFGATGNAGNVFSYQPTTLRGADSYQLKLYVDFALTGVTLVDASIAPVPEPGEWAMMLAGLGVLGIVARRRAARAATA